MGEGKSAVVAPLLGLLLASEGLVLQVVPDPLLSQSLAMTRALFGQAFFRPVYHIGFDRSDANSTAAFALLRKVARAVKEHAAVCSTASSIKSCVLAFVEAEMKLARPRPREKTGMITTVLDSCKPDQEIQLLPEVRTSHSRNWKGSHQTCHKLTAQNNQHTGSSPDRLKAAVSTSSKRTTEQ
ncbi:unnamed protein product [Symbiodinium pilosum]|uniref:DUF3638 domain-containing protein n=1 Tax=Symbiodinium pilosum TaxID=2952 RepID=A0A812VZR0_SYMPI|nr:unnamed protein product [Symbiodinium pilosum]